MKPLRGVRAWVFFVIAGLLLPSAATAQVVISQVYGGGGNTGATLKNDYIELFNMGSAPVNLGGWTVQYASAAGSTWQSTTLSGSIAPGGYFLIQQAAGAGGTLNLPTPNISGSIAMSATSGKVGLVSSFTTLSGTCPTGGTIVDFVGYGTANCFEGGGAAPTLSNTLAALRAGNGCTDTNNNSGDFTSGTPNPRNSASPTTTCGGPGPGPTIVPIHTIQGSGLASPLVGTSATTTGIVTGLKSNGYFIQTPDANVDSDPNTSQGLFVFTGSTPPAAAAIGNAVQVTGTVVEFVPGSDPASPSLTELSGASTTLLSAGNALPAPMTITLADTNPAGTPFQLEKYEGMRVFVASLVVTGPTLGSVSEANATATSNGVFYGVLSGTARPFREPGVDILDTLPPGSPCCVPRFDTNPERLRVDSDAQPGSTAIDVTAGATVMNITGVLDYAFRTWTILPEASAPPVFSGNIAAVPVSMPGGDEFTVATFNMERFFDTVNDPLTGDAVLSQTAFDNRLNKAWLIIGGVLHLPDILGVVEVENLGTLQALAAKINSEAVGAGLTNPGYQAYLMDGNDPGGIDSGFLVKNTVNVNGVTQHGLTDTFINPLNGQPEILNDRPPLLLDATITRPGYRPVQMKVIVNHLRSLTDVNDSAQGPRVRAKRNAQAEFLANLIQSEQTADPNARIVSIGDYNAYQFNDGFVDVLGTIRGLPATATEVVLASSDLVNPDLTDLIEFLSADSRYSFVFDGNAQTLDHILVNPNALNLYNRIEVARVNADFPEVFRSDSNRPERLSDHDVPVAYFLLPPNTPPVANAGPDQTVECSSPSGAAVTLDASGSSDADGDNLTYRWTDSKGNTVGTTTVLQLVLLLGTHTFTLTVDDGLGGTSSDEVTVHVVDTTAPTITVSLSPSVLWPVNHKLREVAATIQVSDACDPNPAVELVSITSSEAPDALGAGKTSVDIVGASFGTDDRTFFLRAERSGNGNGRIYAVTYRARDASGNVGVASATVTVPHNQ